MSSLKVTCTEEMYQAFKTEAFSPSADSETMADAFKNAIELACMIALRDMPIIAWVTEDYQTDKSATTFSEKVADDWRKKGWPVKVIRGVMV